MQHSRALFQASAREKHPRWTGLHFKSPCAAMALRSALLVSLLITCPIHATGQDRDLPDQGLALWCNGDFAADVTDHRIPDFQPEEINRPAPSGLTLLGTLATRLLQVSSRIAVLRIQADAVPKNAVQRFTESLRAQNRRLESFRDRMKQAIGQSLPNTRPNQEDKRMAEDLDRWGDELRLDITRSEAEIVSLVSGIQSLIAAGADPDAPMIRELCITPRDIITKASREHPESREVQNLLEQLSPEPLALNAIGDGFVNGPTIRDLAKTSMMGEFAEFNWTPSRIAETLPGTMRDCTIADEPRVSFCPRAVPALPKVVAGRDASTSPASDPPDRTPAPQAYSGNVLDWHQAIARESMVAQNWFLARDGDRCLQVGGNGTRMSCDGWFPIGASVSASWDATSYHARTGRIGMPVGSVLPDGYHVVGEPARLIAIRAGQVLQVTTNPPVRPAFIWPDFAIHRTVAPTNRETIKVMQDELDHLLERWPSVVNFTISSELDCDAACTTIVSTEMVQAVADWKHHVRPVPIDVLFAVDTPAGLFVDNNYLVATAHLNNYITLRRWQDPGFGDWIEQKYDPEIRNMVEHSVVAKMFTPFIGYSILPMEDGLARDRRFIRRGLNSEWITFPMKCPLERAFESSIEPKHATCAVYSPRLRLSLRKAALGPGIVAKLDGRNVVLSDTACYLDGRGVPIPGWATHCGTAGQGTKLADVLRHEVGHWFGIGHVAVGISDSGWSDVMEAKLPDQMVFSPASRDAALKAMTEDSRGTTRTDEEIRH